MKFKGILSLIAVLAVFFQFSCYPGDVFTTHFLPNTDFPFGDTLSAYYDLRDRSSLIQVTNGDDDACNIHVQIFQHDRGCSELNFEDTLTPNDTVIYNLDNIVRNNGEAVPANLSDNSYGYVVVLGDLGCDLIGNFRIIDDSGYEYRTNMANAGYLPFPLLQEAADFITQDNPGVWEATVISDNPPPLYANFNTVDGANLSDVVGFSYFINTNLNQFLDTDDSPDAVVNYSDGVSFDIFVFDMNEDPLSCDSTVFSCGGIMNYGVNEDYRASRGEDLICPGGGLADPNGGYISFENGTFLKYITPDFPDGPCADGPCDDDVPFQFPFFIGLIGINNGDGTGSMDYWYGGPNIFRVENVGGDEA